MKKQEITFTVNGIDKDVVARNADTLLHVLRVILGFTSVKPGCHNGDCGTCTILIDGIPYNACHMLAVEAMGKNITTIEGLMDASVQEAFIKNWAIQCGYCTPGFILNSYALITRHPDADESMMKDWLDSNLCRCTGYEEIKQSVKEVLAVQRQNE